MRHRRFWVARSREDSGAQMVEFALILPVLLIIVLGIINFGFLFGQKLSLNQAVREGARLAVVPGVDVANPGDDVDTLTEIQDAVRSSLGGLVPSGDVDVTALKSVNPDVNATTGCKEIPVGESLWVRAEYPASLLVPLPVPGLPNTFNLTSESVFRCEWSG